MQCPKCGYLMDAFAVECPRCAQTAAQAPAQPQPARQTTGYLRPSVQARGQAPANNMPAIIGVVLVFALIVAGVILRPGIIKQQ